MWVLTSVGNKRGDLGGQVDMVGSHKFSRGEELIPFVLVVVAEHSDVRLVDTLCCPLVWGWYTVDVVVLIPRRQFSSCMEPAMKTELRSWSHCRGRLWSFHMSQ